jgi:hypothetical protein
MNKKMFEDELIVGMQQELRKQASADPPNLVKAAECLHAALEIFEGVGLQAKADQVLQVLEGISKQAVPYSKAEKVPAPEELMAAGITQRDMQGLAKGDKSSVAKFNIVLRQMGISDHAMGQLIGPTNVMSEEDARKVINPNLAFSKVWEMQAVGQDVMQAKHKQPSRPDKIHDPHTKGLTPDKEVENLKHHGIVFNMADDGAAEDALMNMEVQDDALEVSDQDVPLADFEDERN